MGNGNFIRKHARNKPVLSQDIVVTGKFLQNFFFRILPPNFSLLLVRLVSVGDNVFCVSRKNSFDSTLLFFKEVSVGSLESLPVLLKRAKCIGIISGTIFY
jgi:hypothetical protein